MKTIKQLQLLLFVTHFNNQVCFDNFDISGSVGEKTVIQFHRIGARKLTLLEDFSKHILFSMIYSPLWNNIDTSKIEQQKVKFFYF